MGMMENIVIVDGLRTAVGKFGASLRDVPATELGAAVVGALLERTGLAGTEIDEVIMGNVLQAGLGQNPARQAALKAGLPDTVPAFTVNKVCGSGLKSVNLAALAIACGEAQVVVAGGMENMSRAPYLLQKARWGFRMGNGEIVDAMVRDGLWCALGDYHMGVTAENIAQRYGISRGEQDAFAAASQQKAGQAIEAGVFDDEIVPVTVPQRKGDPLVFCRDEFPRPDTTPERLAVLKPAFKPDGTVTAGNASGINDGAAAVIVASAARASALGLRPRWRVRAFASAGGDPAVMGLGPVWATRKVLSKTGLSLDDFDLIEANEAFAAQSLAVAKEMDWPEDRVNVHGGAIAFGHPIGATGAKLLVNLIHALERRSGGLGLVTLCIGGGQGIAAVVEREA